MFELSYPRPRSMSRPGVAKTTMFGVVSSISDTTIVRSLHLVARLAPHSYGLQAYSAGQILIETWIKSLEETSDIEEDIEDVAQDTPEL
jgi:hypothetical protein